MTAPSRLRGLVAVGMAFAAALSAGACSDSSDDAADTTSGVVTTVAGDPGAPATTATTGSVAPTTTAAPPTRPAAVGDWDGVRFDIGVLDRIDRTEDGRTLVVFDRMQLETETGRKSGKDFTSEPIVFGNTDHPFVNDNTALRTYVASPRVEVLRLVNVRETCPDGGDPAPPRWEPVTVDRVVDQSMWKDYPQVSLTFSADGYVSRLRLASGC